MALASLPATAAAEPACTDTWTATTGEWKTTTSWSAGHVPASGDVACIPEGKSVEVTSAAEAKVVEGKGTVTISNGSLKVTGSASEPSVVANLTIQSTGTLTGPGTVDISGQLNWHVGTMSGTGSTVLESTATATIYEGTQTLSERALVNNGTFAYTSGKITPEKSAKITNNGLFKANTEFGTLLSGDGTASFVNTGTFAKSTGTGTGVIEVPFENTGTVGAETGAIQLRSGASGNGNWSAAAGAKLEFWRGTFSLSGGTLSGPGTVSVLLNATLTIPQESTLYATSLTLAEGTITGAGLLDVVGAFSWSGGTMSGTGSTILEASATTTIGAGFENVVERSLVNRGTFNYERGLFELSKGATIVNEGIFDANSESGNALFRIPVEGGPVLFVNSGTFAKTKGTGTGKVEVPFENVGQIVEEMGKFEFKYPVIGKLASAQNGGPENPSTPGHPCPVCGHPVVVATGDLVETQTDLSVGGRGVGLNLTRTYNSQAAVEGANGIFGHGWSSSFSDHLVTESATHRMTLYQADGATVPFVETIGGSFVAPAWSPDRLSGSEAAGYTLTFANQTKYKFSGSTKRLETVTDRFGNEMKLTYEGEKLTKITDPTTRSVTLAYKQGTSLVEKATDPMGHEVKYTYDSNGNLESVTEPGETNKRWQFTKYDSSHQLEEVLDGKGGKTINKYNSSHQVESQTDPMGRKLVFTYGSLQTKVTNEATTPHEVTLYHFTSSEEPSSITRGYETSLATTQSYTYNAGGYVASETDGNQHTTEYGYDAEGNRTRMLDADHHETKWAYDSLHDVKSITSPRGEITTIKRNGTTGAAEEVKRPINGQEEVTNYAYEAHGELKSATVVLGPSNERTWKYGYDSHGDRTSEEDPKSDKRIFAYNEDSQLVSTVSPRGNSSEGEPLKFTTSIERDQQGRPLVLTEPSETFLEASFENSKIEVPNGLAIDSSRGHVFVSDSWDAHVEEFSPTGVRERAIGNDERKGSGTEEFQAPRQLAVDAQGNLWIADSGNHRIDKFKLETGKVEVTSINKQGTGPGELECPSSVAVDSGGNVWVTDSCNDRVSEFTEGGVLEREFGKKGEKEDEAPNTLRWPEGIALDASGNVWVSDWGDSRVDELKPEAEGKLTLIKQFGVRGEHPGELALPDGIAVGPEGNIFVSDYQNGRLQVFNSSGKFLATIGTSSSGNGLLGGPGQQTVPTQSNIWVTQRSGPQVQHWRWFLPETKYAYEENGNLKSITNPDAHTTGYEYDKDNELTKVTQPNGANQTEYDGAGQVTAQIDGSEHKTEYKRNELEQVKEVIDPLLRHTVKTYDLAGNLKAVKNPEEKTTEYEYEAVNRLQKITYPGNNPPPVTYKYDADGNRAEMTDGTGTTKYTYDKLDRLEEAKDERSGGPTEAVKYGYDLADELTKLVYPNTKEVERAYDKAGRLASVKDWSGNETKFEYNSDSALVKTVFPSGTSNEDRYAYNEADQMTNVEMAKGSEVKASLAYRRDAEGNLTKALTTGLPGYAVTRYGYDENGRLAQVTNGEGPPPASSCAKYEYDKANNWTTEGHCPPAGVVIHSYDAASELTSVAREGTTGTSYEYNKEGARVKATPAIGPATTYTYSQAEELTEVNRPEEGSTPKIQDKYAYSGEGLRTSQTISGPTSYMTWDEAEGLPLLLSDGSNSYLYGPEGQPVEQVNGEGKPTFVHHDQQRSSRMLTGATGAVEGTMTYDAHGNPTGATGSSTTPLGYDGQYTNSDTGLQYLRARNYDPTTAQFTRVDPLAPVTSEPYAFTANNPINNVDPSGLLCAFGYCVGWHPVNPLKATANFFAGFANAAVGAITVGNESISAPFCGGGLNWSYGIGQVTAGLEAGVAAGPLGEAAFEAGGAGALSSPIAGGQLAGLAGTYVGNAGRASPWQLFAGAAGAGTVGGIAGNIAGSFASAASRTAASAAGGLVASSLVEPPRIGGEGSSCGC